MSKFNIPAGLEIYLQCDATECRAEQRVYSDTLPPGWAKRGRKTYCPEHAEKR